MPTKRGQVCEVWTADCRLETVDCGEGLSCEVESRSANRHFWCKLCARTKLRRVEEQDDRGRSARLSEVSVVRGRGEGRGDQLERDPAQLVMFLSLLLFLFLRASGTYGLLQCPSSSLQPPANPSLVSDPRRARQD
jgi:hypothetical protein